MSAWQAVMELAIPLAHRIAMNNFVDHLPTPEGHRTDTCEVCRNLADTTKAMDDLVKQRGEP